MDARKKYRGKIMALIVYIYSLPYEYQYKSDKNMVDYIKQLILKLSIIMCIDPCFKAYAILHEGEVFTQDDYDKERMLVGDVYTAYRNNADNSELKIKLFRANNTELRASDARNDALNMTKDEFCDKYCRIESEWIDIKIKKPHIHMIFYYDYKVDYRFNLYTIREKLAQEFADNDGRLIGILNPIIPYGDINYAVRYLTHIDNKNKKQYDPKEIICYNCNDAMERFLKAAPSDELGDKFLYLYHIAISFNLTSYVQLCSYLRYKNPEMFEFAFTPKGSKLVREAAKNAYFENFKEKEDERRREEKYNTDQFFAILRKIADNSDKK